MSRSVSKKRGLLVPDSHMHRIPAAQMLREEMVAGSLANTSGVIH